ncbi:hypothetical protein BC830DRAFT_270180 [Chytriomyces sp. MP71]|nr:hypothetical protein BC830DRAFT_270180 [Chytriomyces sp. MP71]
MRGPPKKDKLAPNETWKHNGLRERAQMAETCSTVSIYPPMPKDSAAYKSATFNPLRSSKRSASVAQLRWQSALGSKDSLARSIIVENGDDLGSRVDFGLTHRDHCHTDSHEDITSHYNCSLVTMKAIKGCCNDGNHKHGSKSILEVDDEILRVAVDIFLPSDPEAKLKAISTHVLQNAFDTSLPKNNAAYTDPPLFKRLLRWALHKTICKESRRLAWWTFLIDLMHLWLLIMIPVQLGWTEHFANQGWVIFYLVIDAIMLGDCYIQARVDYDNEYGLLVDDPEKIIARYVLHCNGWLEIPTSLPWELLQYSVTANGTWNLNSFGSPGDVDPLRFFQSKIWALILFIKIFLRSPYMRIYQNQLPTLAMPIARLFKCMVIMLLIGHVDACLFWFIDFTLPEGGAKGHRWINSNNLIAYEDTSEPVPFSTQYLVSYLAALRSLVLKLRECSLDAENIFVIFEFVTGILAYGTVFANIHSIIELLDSTAALNQAEELHNFEMEGLISYMKEKKIQPELQKKVKDYKELQWQKSKGLDEELFFDGIPKAVQQEIKNFLYLDLVQKVPIFQGTDIHFQQTLAQCMF